MNIYCVKDIKAESVMPIFNSENDDTAKRSVLTNLRRNDDLWDNAEDFVLLCLGSYNRLTGRINACDPKNVADLVELKAVLSQQEQAENAVLSEPGPVADLLADHSQIMKDIRNGAN